MEAPKLGPLCKCGCGGYLPDGSSREYKRGHSPNFKIKTGQMESATDRYIREHMQQQPSPILTEMPEGPQPNPFAIIPPVPQTDNNTYVPEDWADTPLTLEDAIAQGAYDPEPSQPNDQPNDQPIRVTKKVINDVEGKLAFMMVMTGNAITLVDNVCGPALIDNAADMSAKLAPVLCKSPAVVKWFMRSSNIMLYVDLAVAIAPFASVVLNHHLRGHDGPAPNVMMNGQPNNAPDPNMYVVR